jgi:hypothetical protein
MNKMNLWFMLAQKPEMLTNKPNAPKIILEFIFTTADDHTNPLNV